MMGDLIRRLRKQIPFANHLGRATTLLRNAHTVWKVEGARVTVLRSYQTLRTFWRAGPISQLLAGPFTYADWIVENEPTPDELAHQPRQVDSIFAELPLISLITPVYNPPPAVLRETLASVRAQTYPHWEFCLVNGGSDVAGVRSVLDEFAALDERIRVRHLDRNLGIAGNSNEALAMARGDFVALVDHDDLLAPNMLFEVVKAINRHPEADIVYFDEDKVSEDGTVRREPFFKPDAWSPDLLLSTNYLMHSVIRRRLLTEVGRFDPEAEGAQDWDLLLRCTERTQNIVHIPKILYHWRQVPGSASRDPDAKPWAFDAQKKLLEAHLERMGVPDAEIEFPSLGRVHVRWPASGAKVSIIIPTKDNVSLLQTCLTSIGEYTRYPNYEILLLDTGSTEEATFAYYDTLAAKSNVTLVEVEGPFNYSRVNNIGVRRADGDLLLFLNNDVEVLEPGWVEELAGWIERPGVGVVGPKLLYPDGSIQQAGMIMGLDGHGSHLFEGAHEQLYGPFGSTEWYRNYMVVTGACLMIRRDVFEEVGGFDETYQIGYSDIELCLRVHDAGYRIVYNPFARLIHHEGGSRGRYLPPSDVLRATIQMLERVRAGDPYFNPNLSYWRRVPAFARPDEESREKRLLRILHDFELIGTPVDTLPNRLDPYIVKREFAALERVTSPDNDSAPVDSREHTKGRLLVISHDLSLSGAPMCLWTLARYLSDSGYDVTVLAPELDYLYARYLDDGIRVILEPHLLDDVRCTLKHLATHDVVIANTILAWRAVHAARALCRPSLWWIHESTFGRETARTNQGIADAFSAADAVVFPARHTADLYAEFSTRQNYVAIHNGFEPQRSVTFEDGPARDDRSETLHIVNVASIEPRKGQDVLLKSLAALPENVRVECSVIGRTLDRGFGRKIESMASKLPNVHLLGELPHDEVLARLNAADVFVLSSRDEALPVSLLEAMSLGKAIISTTAGGIDEILEHEMNALLAQPDDSDRFAGHISLLYHDRRLLGRLGRCARTTYEEYLTVSRFGAEFARVIERVRTRSTLPDSDLQPSSQRI